MQKAQRSIQKSVAGMVPRPQWKLTQCRDAAHGPLVKHSAGSSNAPIGDDVGLAKADGTPGEYPRLMRDIDIRVALDRDLRALHAEDPGTVIRHEVGLEEGRRRIDVATVNGAMSGWEIKSDVDTLTRLAGQADAYGRVLDFVTIVTTPRYIQRATAMLPEWWGVIEASAVEDDVLLRPLRPAAFNTSVEPMALVQLLWRDEAMEVLRERKLQRGLSGKARWYVWSRLADALPLEELKTIVRDQIKARPTWPGGQLQTRDDATLQTHATA
jgi:hypothetical protein